MSSVSSGLGGCKEENGLDDRPRDKDIRTCREDTLLFSLWKLKQAQAEVGGQEGLSLGALTLKQGPWSVVLWRGDMMR